MPIIPYSGKLSREKTFTNFVDLMPFVKVFSTKSYISRIRGSFLPRKFPAILYMVHSFLSSYNLWKLRLDSSVTFLNS